MRVLNDFCCVACGATHEYFTDNDSKEVTCQDCSGVAVKVQRAVRFTLEGWSGDYPTASDKWEKKRMQKYKLEQKQADNAL